MVRDKILHKVRTALGHSSGQQPEPPPPILIRIPEMSTAARVNRLLTNVENLAGRVFCGSRQQACDYVARLTARRIAIASESALLRECGITNLPNVRTSVPDPGELRSLCATADYGITGADYALADTGTLVLFSSRSEPRLISLLPPAHIAVVHQEQVLTGLDELFSLVPDPARLSSSMVMITGPSRTADIEQILVRGVHGPGEIHVVVVQE